MKKFKIISLLLSLFLIVSCSEDYLDYHAPDSLSDTSWLISLDQTSQSPFDLNAGSSISFFDLSQGAISHEWIIEEGNAFLKEGFNSNDSLQLFIDKEQKLSTTKQKAHVLFLNSGENKIRLLDTFNEYVSRKTSLGTFEAVKKGNIWVIDTSFVFNVYDYLKPSFKVSKDGSEIINVSEEDIISQKDSTEWPLVEIEAGAALTFEDLSTIGEPNGRQWSIPNGAPKTANGKVANIKFFKLGTFNAGKFTSSRIAPLPTSSLAKFIPLRVKVIPSTQPLTINGLVKEQSDETLRFQVTGEINEFTGQESFFTVQVTNESGFTGNIDVINAKVSETDATYIELKLKDPIYSSDVIKVSYANGNITSTDNRVLDNTTTPIAVTPYYGNNILSSNADFERADGDWKKAYIADYWVGNGNDYGTGYYYERVTTKSANGNASLRFKSTDATPFPGINLSSNKFAAPNGLSSGRYKVSFKVFKPASTDLTNFITIFTLPTWVQTVWDISSVETDKWVEVSQTIEFNNGDIPNNSVFQIRVPSNSFVNSGITGGQEIYFDDMSFVKIEERP